MLLPIVTKSVARRLTDESISVREAAVSLVGSYVAISPAIASTFHSSLLACLHDSGISVRKRTVKIFQSILTTIPNYKGHARVCESMLQRAADPKEEDAVRDLIDALFCDLWLKDGSMDMQQTPELTMAATTDDETPVTTARRRLSLESTGVVTPTPPASSKMNGNPRLIQKRSDRTAEQMMEVVRSSGSTTYLEALLKKLLGGQADADKGRKKTERKKRQELDQKECGKIVGSLFELLTSIEEHRDARGARVGKDLAATLRTIAAFAEIAPEFVFGKIDTVLPYLKADNGVSMDEESFIVEAACDIICRLTAALDQQVVDRLASTSTAKDLERITCRFGPNAFGTAIRAFSCLSRDSDSVFAKKLLELGRKFYSFLCKRSEIEDFSRVDVSDSTRLCDILGTLPLTACSDLKEKTRNNAHRSLTVLGFICKYRVDPIDASMWDEEVASEELALVEAQSFDWSNIMRSCYRLFSNFLQKVDCLTKCTALRALGGIFESQPRLMLQLDREGLIEELMSNKAGMALQLESLKCWCSILEVRTCVVFLCGLRKGSFSFSLLSVGGLKAEEKRIDEGHAQQKMESNKDITVSKRISGDQDGDATLFGGVLTNHANRLFQMTKSKEPQVRLGVLQVLGLLLRQGLVNPNEAVPHLFALQGDIENSQIRLLALQLLTAEGERRPDTLRRRICAGVKHAYAFQKAVSTVGTGEVSATVVTKKGKNSSIDCIFSSVFKECVANSRKQRHGLFKNLLSLFKFNTGSKSSKFGGKELALLSFASQMLAHLEYRTLDDPLFIIHEATSMVTLQGADTLDQLAALLRPIGLASADECDDDNTEEDALERASRSKFPSRTNEARPLSSSDFDLAAFVEHCRVGMAQCLLLRLKAFLRRTYHLSESRCLEYNPNNTERICDRASVSAEISQAFDASVPRVLLMSKGPVDKDGLIRQYAEFRRLMREENSAEMSLRGSSDEEVDNRKRKADEM